MVQTCDKFNAVQVLICHTVLTFGPPAVKMVHIAAAIACELVQRGQRQRASLEKSKVMDQYFDQGTQKRAITTTSADAQIWFDRGLNWCYGFNHEEGIICFRKVLEYDPECAMAHWGIAYAAGPFYNMPWCDFSHEEAMQCTRFCHGHVQKALALSKNTTPLEAALIECLAQRFQKNHVVPPMEFDRWDDAYANAMREVYAKWPEDFDVSALFAEAIMTRTPWKLWDVVTGEPAAGADTQEALEVLEKGIALADEKGLTQHPAILHLHIHVLEMSPTPERAMRSADILATLCPDMGHMNHMPGHIYVLCGLYDKAREVSVKAIKADRKYLDFSGPHNFYTTSRCHDLHLMMYACMFLGQFQPAWNAANELCENLTRDVIDVKGKPFLLGTMEGYHAMKMHVLVRFGKWQKIIDTPMPIDPELYCVSTSMHHYAKGIAHAALHQFPEAEAQRRQFHASLLRIPVGRKFFNNSALAILAVGEKMLDGELEYHMGKHELAYGHLRESVRRDDALAYSEPWPWMHPPRHALGALLLEQGHCVEAEEVYRTDLGLNGVLQRCSQHPDNVWSLHGLAECLRKRGAAGELAKINPTLEAIMARTDPPITSSCLCRTMVDGESYCLQAENGKRREPRQAGTFIRKRSVFES